MYNGHKTVVRYIDCYTLCLKNVPPLTCYNLYIHSSVAAIFDKNIADKVGIQNVLYFPPHLTNASGETGNPEIASFHLNAALFFTKKNTKHS